MRAPKQGAVFMAGDAYSRRLSGRKCLRLYGCAMWSGEIWREGHSCGGNSTWLGAALTFPLQLLHSTGALAFISMLSLHVRLHGGHASHREPVSPTG